MSSSNPTFAQKLKGKKVGLSLASGFFGFYHQAGVVAALERCGIRPVAVSGASAGALVAALWAAGLNAAQIRDELLAIERRDFWDPQLPWTPSGVGFLAGRRFRSHLSGVLPVHRFEDCKAPLWVSTQNIDTGRMRYFSSGPLIEAVYASCAVPYMFAPARIGAGRYWDGGVAEKVPLVPMLDATGVEAVLVSYLPVRSSQKKLFQKGVLSFLPPPAALGVDVPLEERRERGRRSAELLRRAGLELHVLAPPRLSLGPFSLHKAKDSFDQAYEGALAILESSSDSLLGSDEFP